jgi:hypothetical protein
MTVQQSLIIFWGSHQPTPRALVVIRGDVRVLSWPMFSLWLPTKPSQRAKNMEASVVLSFLALDLFFVGVLFRLIILHS